MAAPLRIALLPGDGIGPEVVAEGCRVIAHLADRDGLAVDFVPFDLCAERYLRDGATLPEADFVRLRDEVDAIYLGALGDPRVPGNEHAKDILLGLRFRLDLYVNFRPVKLLDARYCPLKDKLPADVDFVVFRENTEGLYTGIGGQFKRGTPDEIAIEAELNTRKGVERIVRAAFEHAARTGARSVCMSDKSNAMRHGHDLWQRVFREVAAEYRSIEAFHLFVDVLAIELVRAPERFDVIVTNNLFGDIVTDLGAQLQGGIGLAASCNLHPGRPGLFEPVHGSAPTLAGLGVANPLASILTAGWMLEHLGFPGLNAEIHDAVRGTLEAGEVTRELGGTHTTTQTTEAVLRRLSDGRRGPAR